MNTNMYENPIIQDNLEKPRKHEFEIIEPKKARFACGNPGKKALVDLQTNLRTVEEHMKR